MLHRSSAPCSQTSIQTLVPLDQPDQTVNTVWKNHKYYKNEGSFHDTKILIKRIYALWLTLKISTLRTALMFQNLTQFYHALYYFIAISFNQSISQTIIQWWFLNMAWGDQYGHRKKCWWNWPCGRWRSVDVSPH